MRELIYKSGEKDEFKILNLASNIERRVFGRNFRWWSHSSMGKSVMSTLKATCDQLQFKEGDEMYFLIADGNLRGSTATPSLKDTDGEYDATPAKKATVDRLVSQESQHRSPRP